MHKFNFNLRPRKIVSINYSFLICLPQDWIEHHKLSKGNFLNISVNENGELILTPCKI